jgi:uncharacterized membrane protein
MIDLAGVIIISLGIVLSFSKFSNGLFKKTSHNLLYKNLRQDIGRAILLGLELLVAGDIIRTVTIAPNYENIIIMALLILIRTFVSTTLELELTGRWPWQKSS